MQDKKIILATRNKGKIGELNELLSPFGLEVLGLSDFPHLPEIEEDGRTFEDNALKKACQTARATGLVAVADDSGLEVDFLGGAPGVLSARYSDEPGKPATDERNNQKLMNTLKDVPENRRSCRFVSCMAACAPDGEHIICRGTWEGHIGFEPRGQNGFGYDPLFVEPQLGKTAAELPMREKNARSHRAAAARLLLAAWPGFWERVQR